MCDDIEPSYYYNPETNPDNNPETNPETNPENNPPCEHEEKVRVQRREAVERHLACERLEQRPDRDGDVAGENVPQVGDDGGVELGLGEVLEEGEEEGLQSVLKPLKPLEPYNGWCIMDGLLTLPCVYLPSKSDLRLESVVELTRLVRRSGCGQTESVSAA
jgi:hypothetical protein